MTRKEGNVVSPTTHDVPAHGLAPATPTQGGTRRSMWPLFLVLLIALAPVVLAVLAYYVPSLGLRPSGTTNYGTLIQPQRPMPDAAALPLTDLQGAQFDLNSLKGDWLLVTADDADCPESCVRKLFVLRNAHASQGKEVKRLKRVWFILDDATVSDTLLDAYQGTYMLRANPAELARFLAPDAPADNADQLNKALKAPMWIIDPLGNLMMAFPEDADPIEVRDDIRHLLRASRIG